MARIERHNPTVEAAGLESLPALEQHLPKRTREQGIGGYRRGGATAFVKPSFVEIVNIPATSQAAAKLLRDIGVEVSPALKSRDELAWGHNILKAKYKDVYAETLDAEVAYAKDSRYEMRTVKDSNARSPFGVASGWHLGKTGFQIDYLSPIEKPRKGQEAKDIASGLALMKQMATRHRANALWVEVDPEMRKNYEKAGFVDFATPNRDDPAQLTMMVLPLNNEMKKRIAKEPEKVWDEHITSWYKANWDSLKGPDAVPAREALEKMRTDLKGGRCTWFQALPD